MSSPGPEIIYQTAEGAPSVPVNVTAVATTPFRINIEWAPPLSPNGPFIVYEIRWRFHNSSKTPLFATYLENAKKNEDKLSTSITTTEAGRDHYIFVRAYSSRGDLHNDSEEIKVITYPLPNNLTLVNKSSHSLNLSWVPPEDDSIMYYTLEYSQMGDGSWIQYATDEETTPEVQIFILQDLRPKSQYNFRLILTYRIKQEKFKWPQDSAFDFSTSGDVPSVPGKPQVKHMSRDVYQVYWDASHNYGYEDMFYELQMRSDKSEEDDVWIRVCNSSETQWIIESVSGNINYEFRVQAVNEFGASNFSYSEIPFYLPETEAYMDPGDDSVGIVIASIIASIILLCIVLVALYIMYQRKEKEKDILQEGSLTTQFAPDVELATLQDLPRHGNFVHQTNALYNLGDLPTDEELISLPQIKRDQIMLTKFLGSGAFGEVFEGLLRERGSTSPPLKIAIKTLKKGATNHVKEEFLKEAKLMSNFKHDHILQLLGVCFDNNLNFIILELMEGGDLLTYLRSNRKTACQSSKLTMDDLLSICVDVAEGCKYLEEMHFVHRDLAARNCLVSSYDRSQRIVKIGDFGLARDIYKSDYYRKKGEGLLPIRWMAPESLMFGVFTSQSDVWSFGVLLWEIMTLGQQPYPALRNMQVLDYVKNRGRLDKPENCPDDLHQIMSGCWNFEANHRPTFCYCLNALQDLRTKLQMSPAVYNVNYLNDFNIGTYIGRNFQNGDKPESNADSRSIHSDPETSQATEEPGPNGMRRTLSLSSLPCEQILPNSSAWRNNSLVPGRPKRNTYLQLLSCNEDSSGYQMPLKFTKLPNRTLECGNQQQNIQKECNACSVHNRAPSSCNKTIVQPPSEDVAVNLPLLFKPKNNFRVPDQGNSISAKSCLEVPSTKPSQDLELFNDFIHVFRAISENSLSDDDSSLSTASTATYQTDYTEDNPRHSGISTLSAISGIDLDYISKSSYC